MFGNETEARFIRDWRDLYLRAGRTTHEIPVPEDWKKLGSGCYRTAYLSPSGVVYKVQHRKTSWQTNVGEAEKIRSLMFRKLPKGCRLPRFALYDLGTEGVLAMEKFDKLLNEFAFYSFDGSRYWGLREELMQALNLWDLHGANVAIDKEGLVVPIDLGEG